ncbi:protein transporter tim10 [Ceratobasidium sp. 392]|nr:protein transporter tim10 [Ceratobasidium sp. 392]
MSMFGLGGGGGGSRAPSGSINYAQIDMATAELDMVTDVFNRLVSSCHSKCVSTRYSEPDLNKGESVCIDRCVAKFFEVNRKVGEKLQSMGQGAASAGSGTSFGF